MDIIEREIGTATVLDVRGNLYGFDAGCRLERAVDRLSRAGRRTIVANLEQASTIDAGGLGALVDAYRACVRNHVRFRIVRASRRTRHLLVATRLTRVLTCCRTIEDALDEECEMPRTPRGGIERWERATQRPPP